MSNNTETDSITVFISYNKADKAIAREIAFFFTAEGINVWFDEWVISAGDSIVQKINSGLSDCTHFIILWSENAAKSNWVRKELHSTLAQALEKEVPRVIPILLDKTALPALLSDISYIKYQYELEKDQRKIVEAVWRRTPTNNFHEAIIKMYHEVIEDQSIPICDKCGNIFLEYYQNSTEYDGREIDYDGYYCRKCGNLM